MTNETKKPQWSTLLSEVVSKPGTLSSCYSTFHTYSIGNQLLAWSQLKAKGLGLSPIASYKDWQKLGRQVKKGEKALALVRPIVINKKDAAGNKTDETFAAFMLQNAWFSLDQTEGEEFKHEAKTAAWDAEKALQTLNITQVKFDMADGNCQGYAFDECIAINPVAALPHKTRFHELAHVVLGHTKESRMQDSEFTPRDIKEAEAESVAYILCSVLELPGLDESRGYVQNWLQGANISDKSAQKIFAAADKILKAGQ